MLLGRPLTVTVVEKVVAKRRPKKNFEDLTLSEKKKLIHQILSQILVKYDVEQN